jgi:hypothetical protein
VRIPVSSPSLALAAAILLVTACAPETTAVPQTVAPEVAAASATTPPTSIADSSGNPLPDWQTYTNRPFGISFQFPSIWYGPEVYEVDNEIRFAVGSDVVYPYGTSPDTDQASAENSYLVVIQYKQNRSNWTHDQYRENQPWFDDYLSLLDLKDGESTSTARSLTIRVREIQLGRFAGAEFISTLSQSAQTEPFYSRSAFLIDEHLNVLLILGSPNNVVVSDPTKWRETFQAIDEANLDVLHHILDSIQVE